MGTVGYMSPEQVRGEAADHRSDIFSLGCVLYEMLTGRRAFQKPTGAETMTAILQADPLELSSSPGADLPPALERILRHSLEKSPRGALPVGPGPRVRPRGLGGRYRPLGRPPRFARGVAPSAPGRRRCRRGVLPGARPAGGLGARAPRTSAPAAEPRFTRLTFEQGTVWNARFTPDAQTVVYDAAWNGQPIRLFFTRLDTPQSMPVSLPDAGLLGVSQTGELAVSLGHSFEGWMGEGTLARAPLLGGGARPVLEGVREADFSPDGSQLAIVRRVDGRERLELPAGRVLYETAGYISHVRVSPRGDRIAFADHALWADDVGTIAVVDLSGAKKTLTDIWAGGVSGLAWSPSGEEVWFTASPGDSNLAVRAVDLAGRQRVLLAGLTDLFLFDVVAGGAAPAGPGEPTADRGGPAGRARDARGPLAAGEHDGPLHVVRRPGDAALRPVGESLHGLRAARGRLTPRPRGPGRRVQPLARRAMGGSGQLGCTAPDPAPPDGTR